MKIKLSNILYGAKYLPIGVLLPLLCAEPLRAETHTDTVIDTNLKQTAQQQVTITGKVTSADDKDGIPGATVSIKGIANSGTVTDIDGNFKINVPVNSVLVFSFVGYKTVEKVVGANRVINVVLTAENTALEEVVVVAYGKQKKESMVAAIGQVSGTVLERTGGVSSLGAALTGNLPGVITTASSGMPGEEDPQILIRGMSTWNNSGPLILVDGIERPMNTVPIGSVESVSILKDASATAVYGSRGANGVILITTKRGSAGKAIIRARASSTMKSASQLPGKLDAYDTFLVKNQAIENELSLSPSSWGAYKPQAIIDKYRNPANLKEAERYPNVDWAGILFKDYAMSYNTSIDVRGGTEFVKYFASADFLSEGDLFQKYGNNRGYEAGYGFNRLNVRSNLDFQITSSTVFKVNLSGSHGVKKAPWGVGGGEYTVWSAAYSNAPDAYIPKYADGTWGYFLPDPGKANNSVSILAVSGIQYVTNTQLTTDFTLEQDLGMITKGLDFRGTVALDNRFTEGNRGINDLYNSFQEKWIDPETGLERYKQAYDTSNKFDFQEGILWNTSGGSVNNWMSFRKLFYQMQLNYKKTFAENHDFTAMGLFNRNENAYGSEVPRFREDWVFRTTYGYKGKYLFEYNGAYNGSEQFAEGNRFAFFSSGGLGWMISKEKFMNWSENFLDSFKFRGSYGEIGDDNVAGRWLYLTQWGFGGKSLMGSTGEMPESSGYNWYKEVLVGNPDIHWEKVNKTNVGVDFSLFKGLISGNFDFFADYRTDILIDGNRRAVPGYFGTKAPAANLGRVRNKGYEFEIKFNKTFNKLNLWANLNMTHAEDKVLYADDPALLPEYQKQENKQINPSRSYISSGYYNTWDEVYGSTMNNSNDNQKLPGNFYINDYNSDGVIDAKDNVPYGYSGRPQNTYNATLGVNYKGFSAFVQFYGVNNVTRQVVFNSLGGQNNIVYDQGSFWSKDNVNGDVPLPRWLSTPSGDNAGTRYMYDGSYVRLKYAEIAYTFNSDYKWVKALGMEDIKFYLNGNNLFLWTKMPDDRESNFAGTGWASQGAYPTVKRTTFGLNITF